MLEIGAGYCDWINNVRAARRVAVDIWPEHADATPRPASRPLVLDVSNGLRVARRRESFDVVLASNVLEHFGPDAAAAVVRGVARLLRPGGRLRR